MWNWDSKQDKNHNEVAIIIISLGKLGEDEEEKEDENEQFVCSLITREWMREELRAHLFFFKKSIIF